VFQPSETKIDLRQLKALVRLTLIASFRPQLDAKLGKVGRRPLRALFISYGLFGFFFSRTTIIFGDARSYAIVFFGYAISTTLLTVLPDGIEGQERRLQIVLVKPIGQRTRALANVVHLFIMDAIVSVALGLVPISAVWFAFDAPISSAVALFFALLFASFSGTLVFFNTLLVIASVVRLERLRAYAQVLHVTILVGSSIFVIAPRALFSRLGQVALDADWIRLLPPAWFVDAILDRDATIERAIAIAIPATLAIVAILLSGGPAYMRVLEDVLSPQRLRGRFPWRVRLLRAMSIDRPTRAIASLLMTHASRDDVGRRRLLGLQIMIAMCAALDVLWPGIALPTVTTIGLMILLESARLAMQSPHAAAGWICEIAIRDLRSVYAGLRTGVMLGGFAFPFAVASVLFVLRERPGTAALLVFAYALEAHIVGSLAIAFDPAWPLSREEQRLPPIFGRFAFVMLFGVLAAVRAIIALSTRAIVVYVAVLLLLAALAWSWSRRRYIARLSVS
jgi:hypothetical protein